MPGVGLAAPRDVYNAVVQNTTNGALKVTVTYTMPPNATEEVHHFDVPAGNQVALEQRLVEQGSMTSTGKISEVSVTSDKNHATLKAPFKVGSPTKDYAFVVSADGEGLLTISEPKATL